MQFLKIDSLFRKQSVSLFRKQSVCPAPELLEQPYRKLSQY